MKSKKSRPDTKHGWAKAALALAAALCPALALAYLLQPDTLAALTFWPHWICAAPALAVFFLVWLRWRKRVVLGLIALWLVSLFALADEPAAVVRSWGGREAAWREARNSGRALRVISVNCCGGKVDAADEVIPHAPDVVLVQEAPGRKDLERLGHRLFGEESDLLWYPDVAILARGAVRTVSRLAAGRVLLAKVSLLSGAELWLASVHLQPPEVRLDFWSPACWRSGRELREARRTEVGEMMRAVRLLPSDAAIIVGGDFNAPAGDAVFRLLQPRLRDAFAQGGVGCGNTVINEFPISRFDQIWASPQFRVLRLRALKTRHSDHRLVICDLLLGA